MLRCLWLGLVNSFSSHYTSPLKLLWSSSILNPLVPLHCLSHIIVQQTTHVTQVFVFNLEDQLLQLRLHLSDGVYNIQEWFVLGYWICWIMGINHLICQYDIIQHYFQIPFNLLVLCIEWLLECYVLIWFSLCYLLLSNLRLILKWQIALLLKGLVNFCEERQGVLIFFKSNTPLLD